MMLGRLLRIGTYNVRILGTSWEQVFQLIEGKKLDIFVVTETILSPEDTPPSEWQYESIAVENGKAGGILIIIRNDIKYRRILDCDEKGVHMIAIKVRDYTIAGT